MFCSSNDKTGEQMECIIGIYLLPYLQGSDRVADISTRQRETGSDGR